MNDLLDCPLLMKQLIDFKVFSYQLTMESADALTTIFVCLFFFCSEPSENRLGSEDGDYLTVEQLHMPSDNLQVRMKAEQRKKLSPLNGRSETATRAPNRLCLDKSMSTSITELLLNTGAIIILDHISHFPRSIWLVQDPEKFIYPVSAINQAILEARKHLVSYRAGFSFQKCSQIRNRGNISLSVSKNTSCLIKDRDE